MPAKTEKAEPAPETGQFIIDRVVWHTPGEVPYPIGSEQTLPAADVAHLVAAGFMHLVGAEAAPHSAAARGQQVTTSQPPASIPPPFSAAPLTYSAPVTRR